MKYRFYDANDALFDTDDASRSDLSRTLIYVLLGMLLVEQLLAYSASYHAMPARRRPDAHGRPATRININFASMFPQLSILMAEAPLASSANAISTTGRYQFAQWQSFTEWWQAPLLVLIALAFVGFVIYMYRRDSVDCPASACC